MGDGGRFQKVELAWLVSASAVDVILSVILCLELGWARHKLAARGSAMREVVTRLMVGLSSLSGSS